MEHNLKPNITELFKFSVAFTTLFRTRCVYGLEQDRQRHMCLIVSGDLISSVGCGVCRCLVAL